MIIVSEIFFYPIKSCQGIKLEKAVVTPRGFLGDREFMLVDNNGKFLTQRKYPQLATIQVKIMADSLHLSSSVSDLKPIEFQPHFSGEDKEVEIWRDRTIAIDQGDQVAQWFQTALNLDQETSCRLVRQSPQHLRPINPQYALTENDSVSFADGYPFLLTNTASLDDLNKRLELAYPDENMTVPMNRFRPNIVVNTNEAFIESNWKTIQIGDVQFALVKPCDRCIMINTKQFTGVRNNLQEPLKTLSTYRQFPNQGILFGENMIPKNTGEIEVGQQFKIIK